MGYSMFVSGLTHHDQGRAFEGFTVYSAMSGDAVYLVDMAGTEVHRWPALPGTKVFYGHLLPNGNLLINCTNGTEIGEAAGPRTAVVAELDWAGNCLWFHMSPLLHHAHCRLTNGNTMVIATDVLDFEQSARVLRASGSGELPIQVWSEALWEVTSQGEIAWQWHAHEHLDPEEYAMPDLSGEHVPHGSSREWLHLNAVEELPDGDLLLSFNTISTLIIIDRETGEVKWRAAPETSSQHNPTWVQGDRILVFDNGSRRGFSRLLEIDRLSNEVAWEYQAKPRDSFFSMNVSGCQRLPGGNTLATEGRSGRLFEVTPDGETVWEYINPHQFVHRGQRSRSVFRAYRYGLDSPELRGRL